MKYSKKLQCYCCEKTATTNDHVPPLCFFPKQEYLPDGSVGYRNHLITVPACSDHNNKRSKDDEYAAAVIVMNSRSHIALSIFKSKWIKTLLRREGSLGKRIFYTAKKERIILRKNGILIPSETVVISYEMERIENVIESIARGLYYLESGFQEKWINSCIIISPNFINRDLSSVQDVDTLDQVNQLFIHGQEHQELGLIKKGSNLEVFYYQFFKSEDKKFIIRMVFYGSVSFLAILRDVEASLNPIMLAV